MQREEKEAEATEQRCSLMQKGLGLRAASEWRKGNRAKTCWDRFTVPDSYADFLHHFHLQTWTYEFSDPPKIHLWLVWPSPRSTAAACLILAVTQATVYIHTHAQETGNSLHMLCDNMVLVRPLFTCSWLLSTFFILSRYIFSVNLCFYFHDEACPDCVHVSAVKLFKIKLI